MAKDESQDVETISGVVVSPEQLGQFHELMRQRAGIVAEDRAGEVMERQALQLLAAAETGNVDAIMRADLGGTVQARDADSLEVRILDFEPTISDREDIDTKEGYYLSMNGVVLGGDEDMLARNALQIGGEVVLQTGAVLFMLKVAALEKSGALPYEGRVTAFKTRKGNTVVKFTPVAKRAR